MVERLLEIRKIVVSTSFILSYIILVIAISIGYLLITQPRAEEKFLSLSTLSRNGTTSNYYPSNNTIWAHLPGQKVSWNYPSNGTNVLLPGQKVSWNIYVYNHAGDAQYVSVRIKLINSTDTTPDENSSGQEVYEFNHLLAANASWSFPLNWKISNVSLDLDQGYVLIKGLDIDNRHVDGLNLKSQQGKEFRMILELWRYDTKSKAFVFQGFPESNNERGAWNQIWFNLKV